jgi:hypothetical protein
MTRVQAVGRLITIRSAACTVAAILLLGAMFHVPDGPDAALPPIHAMPATVDRMASAVSGTSAWHAFAVRPLFHASRRPWIEAPAPPPAQPAPITAPAPPPPPEAVLLGIITDKGFKAALLKIGGSPQAQIVHEGQVLDGWTVSSIEQSQLCLSNGGTTWATGLGQRP